MAKKQKENAISLVLTGLVGCATIITIISHIYSAFVLLAFSLCPVRTHLGCPPHIYRRHGEGSGGKDSIQLEWYSTKYAQRDSYMQFIATRFRLVCALSMAATSSSVHRTFMVVHQLVFSKDSLYIHISNNKSQFISCCIIAIITHSYLGEWTQTIQLLW